MSATPIWFGPEDRALFGWLHVPEDGTPRGAVVLCPPIGYDYSCSHRTFRELAERLAGVGLAALRFDYDGTGDSVGSDFDGDRCAAWHRSIELAIAEVRGLGAPSVALVGMRLGALLAAQVASASDVDALVLWDPVVTGKSFVRELRGLSFLIAGEGSSTPDDDPGAIWAFGRRFGADTVRDLRGAAVPDLADAAFPVLLLHQAVDNAARELAASLGPTATVGDAVDQHRLLNGNSLNAVVPDAAVKRVVQWLDDALPSAPAVPMAPSASGAPVPVGRGLREHTAPIGPIGLFGIITEGDVDPALPTLLLLNPGLESHLGPTRMWVDWGREMATHGFRVARVDQSGFGDSPTRAGRRPGRPYAAEAPTDIAEMVADLDTGAGVVLVGLCSGGRHAAEVAARIAVRGICLLNPILHLPTWALRRSTNELSGPPVLMVVQRSHGLRRRVAQALPPRLAKLRRGVGSRLLRAAARRGTDMFLAFGDEELSLFQLADAPARLRSKGADIVVHVLPGLDHGVLRPGPRTRLFGLLTEHLMTTYVSAEAPAEG